VADRIHRAPAKRPGLEARAVALDILLRVEREKAFADVLLGHRLPAVTNPADRRLITQLVLGTIAWQLRIDYELARYSSRKIEELDPAVRAILRMGLYQLRWLTRIPNHAVVDTSVELTRTTPRLAAAGGFVNAILRSALRKSVDLPDRAKDETGFLAVAYSHPRWMVERFITWFGVADAEAIMRANNEAAPTALRLNLRRGTPDEICERITRDGMTIARRGPLPETVVLDGAPLFNSDSFREGLFTIQSEASQMVARLLDPAPGSTVVDCAAAPGGKSTHLAELVGGAGRVLALDRNQAGLVHARSVAKRLGHKNIDWACCDSADGLPVRTTSAHNVLLDAPCTGSGTMREHPELRWRLQPGDFARMAKLQEQMLEQAAAVTAPGGAVVYSVCSLAPQEGANEIGTFLQQQPEFSVDEKPSSLDCFAGLVDADGFVRTRPDRDAQDGFFAARLIRRS